MKPENEIKRLGEVRHKMLQLHKTLLDFQKDLYEKKHGRIRSRTELFRLVTEHPSFSWLHSLSMLIVTIDEALDADYIDPREILTLRKRAKGLIKVSQGGAGFAKQLYRAVQFSPDVVIALGAVSRLLKEEVVQ